MIAKNLELQVEFPPRGKVGLGEVFRLFITGRDRLHLIALFFTSMTAALAELVGVASIAPFMAVLLDPSEIDRLPRLHGYLTDLGAQTARQEVVYLGVSVCIFVLLNSIVSASNATYQAYFANRLRAKVSVGLFERFLGQPYLFHAKTDSSTLTKILFNNVDALTRVITATLVIGSRTLVIVALVGLLLSRAASAAAIAVFTFGGTYALLFMILKQWQTRIGAASSKSYTNRTRIAIEALGGIKELLVLERTQLPVHLFRASAKLIAKTQAQSTLASALPRNVIEPVGMMAVIFIALSLTDGSGTSAASAISTLALFAFVAFRLIPSFQQLYASLMEIKYHESMLMELHSSWIHTSEIPPTQNIPQNTAHEKSPIPRVEPLLLVKDVHFSYPGAQHAALNGISLSIKRGEAIGFVGRSGSGKTTLIDVLLGLYPVEKGQILVSGQSLDTLGLTSWREQIGYVPQHVFLSNATIAENIALGVRPESINRDAVLQALSLSQCLSFVESLPKGVDSVVGERGVRLSGGQRQRIGIARALYHTPEVLILDEATSALDGITEDAVMEAVNGLRGSRTIILIAHRLRTVEACDRIIVLDQGRVVGDGSFADLSSNNAGFRVLAGIETIEKS
ncbi:ABC transporter ATP-binding protein [Gemmatimonas phototrophica]|uniref:ABC transporter ATP-binding protein n=1 Tax=Gemmatimonas phototrophica TaxID=1379270 RepID=A0A143BI07_9BACT|nr:ABC transporter ATP-binding protein [Gemmatimonas phototrophica]AMW04162.1 hypothetical protein GEMMAAP_03575 [Gemmatimonas phototrophica]